MIKIFSTIFLIAYWLVCSFFVFTAPALAQANDTEEGQYIVSVLTFDPGLDLFSCFGHIAIVVEDRTAGYRKVYNFGNYDFRDPYAKWNHAKGNLEYWLSVASYESTLKRYRHFNRGTVLRRLALDKSQTALVIQLLDQHTSPEKRSYHYDHINNNCCTKIRDIIDRAIGNGIADAYQSRATSMTYRDWTNRLLADKLLWRLAFDFVLGRVGDKTITRYQEQYLPVVFSKDLDDIVLGPDQIPLVASSRQVLPRAKDLQSTTQLVDILLLAGIGLFFLCGTLLPIVMGPRSWSRRLLGLGLISWSLLGGGLGLLLVFLCASTHTLTHANENHLLTPFTHLWLFWPGAMLLFFARLGPRARHITRLYLIAGLVLVGVDLLLKLGDNGQNNWLFLVGAALANTLLIVAFFHTFRVPRVIN